MPDGLDHARIHGVALDHEIRDRLARALQLGANAAAARLKIGQRHPRQQRRAGSTKSSSGMRPLS